MEKTVLNNNLADFVVSEDHSLLIKPIMMKSSTVHNIVTFVHDGTPEVRDLLINECEMIFECKVCRSLHRSLANFIAHKRIYCKEHCCEKMTLFEQTEIEDETEIVNPESPNEDDEEIINEEEEEKLDSELNGKEFAPLDNEDVELGVSVPKIFRLDSDSIRESEPKSIPSSSSGVEEKRNDISNAKSRHLYNIVKHLKARNERRSRITVKITRIGNNRNAVYQSVASSDKSSAQEDVVEECTEEPTERNESIESEVKMEMPRLKMAPHVAASESAAKSSKGGSVSNGNIVSVPCVKCRTLFTSIKTLTRHLRSVHGKNKIYFNCLYCSNTFSESWSVVRHILTVHKKTKKQVDKLKKKICQRAFQNILNDTDSSDEGDRPLKTSTSTSPDTSKSLLPTIILQKKQIGHLKCRRCEKIFTKKDSLKRHQRNCSEKRKVKKKQLEQNKSADMLSNGRPKRVVKRREVSDFVPSICHRAARRERKRESSIVAITASDIIDSSSLECNRCLQKFSKMSNARRHAAMHIGWNRFKCKHCDYQSYDRSSCCYHVKRVHATQDLVKEQVDTHIEPVSPSFSTSLSVEKSNDEEDSDQSTSLVEQFTRPSSVASKCDEQQSISVGKKSQSTKKELEDSQSPNETSPPTLLGKATPTSTSFNISTRRHPRFFDISPYRREDQQATLVTRSGSYVKPEQVIETQKKASTSRRKANVKRPERVIQQVNNSAAADKESDSTDDGSLE